MSNELDDIYVEINLTNNCNCRCEYCFEHQHCGFSRDAQEEQRQIQLLLDYCNRFDKSRHGSLTISFWGGEPFMNYEYMKQIIQNTCQFDFTRYHIYSNGTLFSKFNEFVQSDFIDSIRDRIHIQLSYDGEPHHIMKRGNTKDVIFKTAHLLFENGIRPSFKATLAFDMIPYLPSIWSSYEEAFYEFDGMIQYAPTLDTRQTNPVMLKHWHEVLVEVARKEYKFFKKNNTFLMSWFNEAKKCNCQLGNSLYIDVDGMMYICHGCPYQANKEDFAIGSTKNVQKLEDCILDSSFNDEVNDECLQCEAEYCSICHATLVKHGEDVKEHWIKNRSNDKERCKYYKEFGKIFHALQLRLTQI